jgi:hypothetical protein
MPLLAAGALPAGLAANGAGLIGLEAGLLAGGAAPGICMTPWQCGHLPFFPAAASGALIRFRQFGQSNAIGMDQTRCEEESQPRIRRLAAEICRISLVPG